jgi:hypothetical protein
MAEFYNANNKKMTITDSFSSSDKNISNMNNPVIEHSNHLALRSQLSIVHCTLLIVFCLFFGNTALGQGLQDYAFSTGTGGTLYSPSWTQLIASGQDDAVSSVTNIGFTFTYDGTGYTQFSANSNGRMRLGGTAIGTTWSNPFNSSNYSGNCPAIAGVGQDCSTGSAGYVKTGLYGSSGSYIRVIEFMLNTSSSTSGTTYIKFQIQLFQAGNEVRIVYSGDYSNAPSSYQIGLGNASYNKFWYVDPGNHTTEYSTTYTSTTYSSYPGSTRYYSFKPAKPAATIPYACDFENSTERGNWDFSNGSYTNKWMIGTNTYSSSSYSLYISNNGSSYSYSNGSASYVYAYRTINFAEAGKYLVKFKWKAYGESGCWDAMYAALVPPGTACPPASNITSSTNSLPTGYIQCADVSQSNNTTGAFLWSNASTDWITSLKEVTVPSSGKYTLVFYWKNDGGGGSNPPAAVDDIAIVPIWNMTCDNEYSGTLQREYNLFGDNPYPCQTGWQENGAEHIYAYTAPSSGSYTFTCTTVSGDPDFLLMPSASNVGPCVGSVGGGTITATLTAGTTYYLIVDNDNKTSPYTSSYKVSVPCPTCPTVNVGDLTSEATNSYLPSYNFFNYGFSQQIYTPCEIGASGPISSISWYNGGTEKTRQYDIYLVHTNKTTFSSTTDWITVTAADKFYSGTVTMSSGNWTKINLDLPFSYNGTSNLAVIIDDNTGDYTSSPHMACRVYNADGNQAIYQYSDDDNQNPINPSYSGTLVSVKNQLKFGMCDQTPATLYTVSASVSPTGAGTISGLSRDGCYASGSTATITALPTGCYKFVNWTEGGSVVSTNPTYSFTVTSNHTLVANFEEWNAEITTNLASADCIDPSTEMVLTAGIDMPVTYSFTKTTSSFSSISGSTPDGTSTSTGDAATLSFNLPFAFNLAGKDIASGSTVTMRCDGHASLGTYYSAHTPNTPGTSYAVISAFGYDQTLVSGSSYMYYKVTGSAGSRVLTMEWKNMKSYSYNNYENYQIKLYEGSNIVELCYGGYTHASTISVYAYLTADGNITNITSFSSPTVSTNTSGTTSSISVSSASAAPTSGTVYRFTPPTATYAWTYTGTAGTASGNTYTVSPTASENTYTVNVTMNGCTKSASQTVKTAPTITGITSSNGTTVCSSTVLTASSNSDVYEWNTGQTGNGITVTPETNTTYTVTAYFGTCGSTADIEIKVVGSTNITSTPASLDCIDPNTEVKLNAVLSDFEYEFTKTSSSFSSISGSYDGVYSSTGDGSTFSFQLPFDFNLGGKNFSANTTLYMRCDGHVSFGAEWSDHYATTPGISRSTIAVLGYDQYLDDAAKMYYKVTTENGVRVLIMEWNNMRSYSATNSVYNRGYYQVKLYQGSNIVKLCYGSFSYGYSYTMYTYIVVDGNITNVTSSYANPVIQTNTTATTTGITVSSSSLAPTSGTVYTFTPPSIPTYEWSYSGTSGTASNGTYTVSPTALSNTYTLRSTIGSCVKTQSVNVTTKPTVSISSSAGNEATCGGYDVTLTATSNASSFEWNTGDLQASTTVSPETTTEYTVTVSSGSCNSQSSLDVVVTPSPVITASPDPATQCVSGSQITMTVSNEYDQNRYEFTKTSSSFSSISGSYDGYTTTAGDGTTLNVTLPFAFNLAGKDFAANTSLTMRCDGFVTFSNSWSTNAPSSPGTSYNLISALGYDQNLVNNSSYMYYKVTGSTGSRVLTMEWKNMRSYYASNSAYNWANYQVKLYEGSNMVEICYGSFTYNYSTTMYTYITADGNITKVTSSYANPEIQTNSSGSTTGITVNSSSTAPTNGTVYRFTYPSPPSFAWTVTGTSGTQSTVTYTNDKYVVTPTQASNTYTVTNTLTGCTRTETVNLPKVSISTDLANKTLCEGSALNLGVSATGSGTLSYAWKHGTTPVGENSNSYSVASVSASDAGNYSVQVTSTVPLSGASGSCTAVANSSTASVTVNPTITANTITDKVVCAGSQTAAIPFGTNATGNGTVSYSWTNSNTAINLGASGTTSSIAAFTAANSTTAPIVGNIHVTPTYTYNNVSCPGTAEDFTITVNPTVAASNIADKVACPGTQVAAIPFATNATGSGTVSYSWTNSNTAINLGASGTTSSIAAFNATNSTTAPIVGNIHVTPTYTYGGLGCAGTAEDFTIIVNPTVAASNIADKVVCPGTQVAAIPFATNATGSGTVSYSWTNSNTAINLGASGTTSSIAAFNATNSTTAPIVGNIHVTPTYTYGGLGCAGTAEDFTITVNPTVAASNIADKVACAGTQVAAIPFATNATGSGSVSYSWTNSNTAINLGASGTTSSIAAFNATNSTTAPIVGNIHVTPTYTYGGLGCAGTAVDFTITVNPTVAASNIADKVACAGTQVANIPFATNATGSGTVSYSWTNSNTAINLGASGTTSSIAAFTAANSTTAPIVGNIHVTPTYTYGGLGCAGTAEDFTITVNPLPTPTLVTDHTPLCLGDEATLTAGGGETYNWGDGIYVAENDYVVSPTSNTVYYVTVKDANGCTAPININQEVQQAPGNVPATSVTRGHIWTGRVSSDWNDSRNWVVFTGGGSGYTIAANAPTANDQVVVRTGATCINNEPSVNANSTASNVILRNGRILTVEENRTLAVNGNINVESGAELAFSGLGTVSVSGDATIANGATVTFDNKDTLNVAGTFTLRGNLDFPASDTTPALRLGGNLVIDGGSLDEGGTLVFAGSSTQNVSNGTSPLTLNNNVRMNMHRSRAGVPHTVFPDGTIFSKTTIFEYGIMDGNVTFNGTGRAIVCGDYESYASGTVTKIGAGNNFTFPTGDDNVLGSVTARIDPDNTVHAKFHHWSGDNGDGSHGFTTDVIPRWWNAADMCGGDPFNHVSNFEYWDISSPVELSNVMLMANAATGAEHFNTTSAYVDADIQVAAYSNGCWSNFGGSAEISGADHNVITINGANIPKDPHRAVADFLITLGSKTDNTVLPIELVSFTATCDGRSALIEWTTATEKNNDYFSLERSDDAINFTEIARVAGAGNSIEPLDYSYTDYGIHGGDNYYRLVQVDYDGTRTASEIIVANCIEPEVAEPDVQAYPNPFNDELTVVLDNFGNRAATIEVYDMLGKLIYTNKIAAPQNSYETILNLSNLPPAAYTVRVSTTDFVINKNVVKQ